MTNQTILRKLQFVNEHVQRAKADKNWKEYEKAVAEYNRLTKFLK